MPTVKQHERRLESPKRSGLQHGTEMFVLGKVISALIINPIIDGKCTYSVGPEQGDQADPFDDFVMVAAPLKVGQGDLLGIDFVDDRIVQDEPAGLFFDERFNLVP